MNSHPESYRFLYASDVQRDGLAVEVQDETGERVLEVFRYDGREGELTLNSFREVSVPYSVVVELLRLAEKEFKPVGNHASWYPKD